MKAYTLMEMIISVLLLSIILLAGTTLFYQNLKSAGLSDVDSNLGNTLQGILRAVEKDIRYSVVTGVGVGSRTECLAAGAAGLTGNRMYVTDMEGQETVYSLTSDKIASTSSETSRIVYLNTGEIKIESLEFIWYCQGSISDKIKLSIDASSTVLNSGIGVTQSVSADINLLNSGLN